VSGSLLATGLSYGATPFLRYRVSNVATRLDRQGPRGRRGDVVRDVDGRIDDVVMTPDGRLIGRLDHSFEEQLDVAEDRNLREARDAIEVRVVPRATHCEDSERALRKDIRAWSGVEIRADQRLVQSIAREPNGRFRTVKSRVGRFSG
jgi:phenylacetate-CoA ligase